MILAVFAILAATQKSGDAFSKPTDEIGQTSQVSCPEPRTVVYIKANTDLMTNLYKIKKALETANTTVRLEPDVDLDFSILPTDDLPLYFAPCVTLTSVGASDGKRGAQTGVETYAQVMETEARTPQSRGPVLRFSKHREDAQVLLTIRTFEGNLPPDGARISGFRLYGPSFGQQSNDNFGIRIFRAVDIEISNMEIAGWGGAGVQIKDDPPGQTASEESVPGRITNPDQIRIHNNFFHHNQHPRTTLNSHANGYGIDVNHGGWARIFRNVFDFNRHAISAAYDSGGYIAEHNLTLKGGGFHYGGPFGSHTVYTHSFDVHGSEGGDYKGGNAGVRFEYRANAFQYRKGNAIYIRGKPAKQAYIAENIFPHAGLEDDWGDDAINLNTGTNVQIGSGNVIDFDSFGKYGVCDFDGDAIDDLFLPTGATWWFSSSGEFQWTYLNTKKERLDRVRLGYFDNDLRCDVLAEENGGQWVISRGGSGDWQPLGSFGVPLSQVQFGRFDPNIRDHRQHVTRKTTHAFWRRSDGQWFVTPLSGANWQPVQHSGFPMNKLRFGDFTGDGVTDVLAVVSGRWSISESATHQWRQLNPKLGDAVANLFIANMDRDDNIDDILRLETQQVGNSPFFEHITLKWWRSRNGVEPWRLWKGYDFNFINSSEVVRPGFGFAGRFGPAPGGGTLIIDPDRLGRFYSSAEAAVGAAPDRTSMFAY